MTCLASRWTWISRQKVRAMIVARAQLLGGPSNVQAVEIEAMIGDKVVPNVFVDGGMR